MKIITNQIREQNIIIIKYNYLLKMVFMIIKKLKILKNKLKTLFVKD